MGLKLNDKRQTGHSVTAVVVHWLMLLALLGSSGCAWLDGHQRQIIYRPSAGVPVDFNGLRAGDTRYVVNVPNPEGQSQRLAIWWLPHASLDAPTLLYLHGTFRNLFENISKIENYSVNHG